MRHNGEVREQLDQTKARNQDAILILQYQMKRDVGLTEEALENVVKIIQHILSKVSNLYDNLTDIHLCCNAPKTCHLSRFPSQSLICCQDPT